MSTRTARAAQIITDICAALAAAGLPDITVTDDPAQVDKRGAGRCGIILVHPAPAFAFPVGGVTRLSWTVYALTKPAPARQAFAVVDPLLDALIASPLTIESAEPGDYQSTDDLSPPFPGYIVTLHDDYYH